MAMYRDLIVWQKSMALVTAVYEATKSFPKEELYGLASQMRRCGVSIPSNIAEGYGRRSWGEYGRFLAIAMGSFFELQTQLEIARNLGYIDESSFDRILEQTREIERMLSSLIRTVREAKV